MATSASNGPEPAAFPAAFAYEHTDIPPGVTINAYRRDRAAAHRREMAARRAARRQTILRLAALPLRVIRRSTFVAPSVREARR